MGQRVADNDYWADADGKLVDEASDGATLVARKGTAISEASASQYGLDKLQEGVVYDAVADHEAKHAGETESEAREARQRMLSRTGGDDDGPPAKGERSAPATKAVTRAPENK